VGTHDKGHSLWEVAANGRNLHRLLSGWNDPPFECCGSWTPDGEYFLFESLQGQTRNVWAIREVASLLRKVSHEPVQLTTGPTNTGNPLASIDGKKVFVATSHLRGELVHYDSASHQFTPYLSGISATGVSFSRDGKWMTYSPYPEGGLWRSKVDGSERLQLALPSQFVYVGLPSWSPDGARIAFMGLGRTKPFNVYVVNAEGGTPERPVQGDRDAAWPNWSPDGKSLLFGRVPWEEKPGVGPMDLEILDLSTHTISKVPGSEELWDSRWSPDGRYILAKPRAGDRLMLYDFRTEKWTELAKIDVSWPAWSRKGDYIYFNGTPSAGQSGIFRVRMSDHKLEQVVSLKGFRQASEDGNWVGLAADDSPLLVRDAGTHDIYALDWDAP
jgi:Tol biopolymer transport system component